MTASRFGRRPRRDVRRPAALAGVNGPKLFVESLEDRTTPAYNPNPLFVAGTLPSPAATFGTNFNGPPAAFAVGDFNGDGRDDFAGLPVTSANSTSAPRIDVYLSNPTGTGSSYTYTGITTGSGFYNNAVVQRTFTTPSLAAIDVTADGKAELATISQSTGEVIVYQLSNTGAFIQLASVQFDYDASSPAKNTLAVGGITGGDFNNDGKGDFLVSLTGANNGANNEYYTLYNNGDGKSYTPIATAKRTGSSTINFTKPVTADFDADGNDDVAMINTSASQAVVLFGDGAAGVRFVRVLQLNNPPAALAVGDFDNNGRPDLAVGTNPTISTGSGAVTLFLKDDAGTTFQTANALNLGGGFRVISLAAADYDVDTYGDLAVLSATTGGNTTQNIDVYLGSKAVANAGLVPADGTPYSTGTPSRVGGALATFDFDSNGNADFVVGQGTTSGQQYIPYVNQSGVGGETFLTANTSATQYGLPVTYNVVIYPPPLGGDLPTGTVTFFDVTTDSGGNQTFTAVGSNTLRSSLDGEGSSIAVTTFTKSDFSVGQHTVVAKYEGDANYGTTTSNAQTVTIAQGSTTPVVTTTAPDPVFGQPVPLTVTVKTASGLPPTGNVSFFDNGNLIGSGTLDAAGQSTITITNFAIGSHAIVANYLGSTNFAANSSAGLALTVSKANATTTLGISKTAVTFGDPVTLTATVGITAPGVGTPTGTVEFYEGTTKVGQANVLVSSGVATLTLTGLSVGAHTFSATYLGNASVAASPSTNTVGVTVSGTASVTGLVFDPSPSQVGAPVTFTAFVNDDMSPPRPVGVGTVTFVGTDGAGQAVTIGPVAVSNGTAVTTYSALPLGTATFRAVFSGTSSISGSTSAPVAITTQRSTPAVTSTNSVNANTAALGRDVTFNTLFSPSVGLSAAVTGTATFADNGRVLGTVDLVNGLASFTVRLTRGSHTITTTYSGDSVYDTTTVSVPFLVSNPIDSITVGAGAGGTDIVRIYNPDGTVTRSSLFAFGPDNVSGARVASGDINGDGVQDFVIGTGPGTQARVRGFDGVTNAPLFDLFPFENFTGGVFVSVGDVTGDLRGDVVISPDQGGGPRVSIYDGGSMVRVADFFGIDDPNFRGGARTAVGDINRDGANDLVVSAGFGGGPRVAAFDGRPLRQNTQQKLFADFFAFESTLRNGAFVAVGDVDGDGFGDLVMGAGPGGGPRVIAISGNDLLRTNANLITLKANFFAGDVTNRGGVPVATRTLDTDTLADIVTGSGPGSRRVSAYLGASLTPNGQPTPSQSFDAFDESFNPNGGVFVG